MILIYFIILIVLYLYIKRDNKMNNGRNIYVINMLKDKDRYDKIKNSGSNFNIIRENAVDGSKLDIEEMKKEGLIKINSESFPFSKNINRDTLNGSIGCTLSHINLWKKLSKKNDDYFIILEDDAIIRDNTHEKINDLMNKIKDTNLEWDILFLGGSRIYGSREKNGLIRAIYTNSWMNCGLFAYIINRKSIPKLINKAYPINTYIDMQINKYYGNGINAFYTNPHIITHNYDFGSTRDTFKNKYTSEFINDANKIFTIN